MRLSVWHDLPFRLKLIIYGGLVTAVALAITGVVLMRMETSHFREHLLQSTTTLADITSQTCGSSLAFHDDIFATRVLKGLAEEPSVERACLLDMQGDVFASFERPGLGASYDLSALAKGHRFAAGFLELTRPVSYDGMDVGTVYLQVNLTALDERVQLFTAAMLVLLTVAMAVSLVLAGVLQRGLLRPVTELTSAAERVASQRDFSVRARQFGRDELGLLTESFNDMLTRLQEREEALRASEARYGDLLGRIDEVVFRMSIPDGHLEFCSPGAQMLFGHTADELLDDPGLLLQLLTPDCRQAYQAMLQDTLAGRVAPILEFIVRDAEGVERHVAQSNYPVVDESGRLIGLEGLFIDVTERIHAEREREQLRIELEQSHKLEALGTLTGGIAHDFNNILSAIMGNASLAMDDLPDDHPLHETMQTILQASQRAAKLTRQILAFSRHQQAEKESVQLLELLDEALTLLRASLPANISITTRVPESLPTVLADPTQLHQVVMNLCTNAHHAMRENGGRLDIQLRARDLDEATAQLIPELGPGPHVELVVADTGEGIPEAIRDRIFEPFFTTKEKGEGTGMGLSVVYGIVRDHGGRIALESEVGRGTSFRILLPADRADTTQSAGAVDQRPRGQGRVMFIDDEEMIVTLVQRMLERMGYTVEGFANPWLAMEHFETDPDGFDLVITDYTMPNLSGVDVASRIRSFRRDIPVVISTGNTARVDQGTLDVLGDVVLTSKPFDLDQLAQLVHSCLTGGASSGS